MLPVICSCRQTVTLVICQELFSTGFGAEALDSQDKEGTELFDALQHPMMQVETVILHYNTLRVQQLSLQ